MTKTRIRTLMTVLSAALLTVSVWALNPGQYLWQPDKSQAGPVTVVVSVPEQTAYVYRNGVQIGVSSVSTGKPGHETPTGTFTVLEKDADHVSSTYKGAPMPYMERLTWSGVALHAGQLPGYPASHGCVRLPLEFAKDLYTVTSKGTTVVITDREVRGADPAHVEGRTPSHIAFASHEQSHESDVRDAAHHWQPHTAPKDGHLSVLVSYADEKVYVYRDGTLIGHSPVHVRKGLRPLPTGTFVMLDGYAREASVFEQDKAAHRWLVADGDHRGAEDSLVPAMWNVAMPPAFAKSVYEILEPGTVLHITKDAVSENTRTPKGFRIFHHES